MNTLVIGYGGFGSSCVRSYSENSSKPSLVIDSHPQTGDSSNAFVDFMEVGSDEMLNEERLRNAMSDYDKVLLVSSLGGESFSYAYDRISDCARSLEISMVSICTLPYVFETERRARAIENLQTVQSTAHNLFVIDSQKTIIEDTTCADFLDNMKSIMVGAVDILVDIMEHGPFQTYCSDSVYTFAIGESPILGEAIRDALKRPYYDIQGRTGKILVCTGVVYSSVSDDAISSLVAYSGTMPEFITNAGIGADTVLLFIPISFRQHE